MSVDGPIDVEALSDLRWARIERSLFQKLDAPVGAQFVTRFPGLSGLPGPASGFWGRVATLVAASAAAAATSGILAAELVRRAPVAEATSHIETHVTGSHVVVGEASLDVAPESELVVAGDDERGVLVVLGRGHVECEVAPRNGRPPFIVQAGDVRVRVVGTHFAVSRASDDVQVDVAKGIVEVQSHGDTQSVRAGQHWPFEVAASDPAPAPAAGLAPEPPTAALDVRAPVLPTPHGSPKGRVPGAMQARRAPSDASAAPLAPAMPSAPALSGGPAPIATPRSGGDRPLPSPPTSNPGHPLGTRQAQYELAERLEAGDPDGALAAYVDLARGSDEWSAMSLYTAGRLAAKFGQDARARGFFEQYVARFPRGPNAADARRELLGLAPPSP